MSTEADWYRLTDLVAGVMRGSRPMTARQIVRAIDRRARVKTDERSVRKVLMSGRFASSRPTFGFLRRAVRWRLVEAGPAGDPGASGAPVRARPYPPTLSGAAAAELAFREDEPPTDAIGRAV